MGEYFFTQFFQKHGASSIRRAEPHGVAVSDKVGWVSEGGGGGGGRDHV
jgi:hypothetical protein